MTAPIPPEATQRGLHVCFVTDDIDATVAWLSATLGIPAPVPNPEFPQEVAQAHFHGEPTGADFRQAIMSWNGTDLEVIEPGSQPSSWRTFLDENGPGVHHVGFAVASLDASAAALAADGSPVVQYGSFPEGRYLYSDTSARLGTFVELLEFPQDYADQSTT